MFTGARSPAYSKVSGRLAKLKKQQKLFTLLAETFKVLGDESRVRIVWVLAQGELCVGDIAGLLAMSPSGVSHHLRTLRNLHLVRSRREHRTVYYSLDDVHLEHLLDEGIQHVEDLL